MGQVAQQAARRSLDGETSQIREPKENSPESVARARRWFRFKRGAARRCEVDTFPLAASLRRSQPPSVACTPGTASPPPPSPPTLRAAPGALVPAKLDTSSFIKPAQIQVLLVPIHPIKRARFDKYADLIRGFNRILLADVPPDARGERAVFSASPTTPGALLFDYLTPTTYASSHPLSFLSEFQIHRRIHGIIGILDCSEYTDGALTDALSSFQESLKDLPRTFATKVYGFDPTGAQVQEGRGIKEGEGLVMIPGTGDVGFYLNTLLADFASGVLWEFSNLAAQLESRASIPTPQETPAASSPFTYIPHRPTAKAAISNYASSTPVTTSQRPINLAPLGIAPPPQSRTAQGMWGGSASGNQDGFLYGMSIQSNMAIQPGAAPSPPPGGVAVNQKSRKRVVGREKKLMADMWLLAGRLNEAIECYNEAILLTKAWQDQVWQASALEGLTIALVIQAWSPLPSRFGTPTSPTRTATPPPPPDTSTFLSSIPDRLSLAISLYSKMLAPLPSSTEQPPLDPDRVHPLIYAEACLRCARFLLAVWEAGGWIDRALDRLVLPLPKLRGEHKTTEEMARAARLASLAPSNTVPRSSIAMWVSQAYCPQLALLALPIRLRVTGEIASIFSQIGYRRKESFVLRELAALCGEGVGGKLVEVFSAEPASSSTPSTIQEEEVGESPFFVPPTGRKPPRPAQTVSGDDHAPSIVRTTSDSKGNESVVRIVEKVCEAFGIEVVPRATKTSKMDRRKSVIQGQRLEPIASVVVERFGWPLLQVGVLGDAIRIAESLPDYQAAIRFSVTALRALSDTMPSNEQYRLSQNIPRIFAAATRRGAAFDLEYWGPNQLVMSLEVAPLTANRLPFEHSYQEVNANAKATSAAIQATDPFIYNPKRGPATAKARPTLVQNEQAEVFVTLQNPFLFDLDIQSIELSTSGAPFACDPLSVTVPPGSFHTVRLTGTPRQAGLLTIRGCNIRLSGCALREFLLPFLSDDEEATRLKDAMLNTSKDRVKATGLVAFSSRNGSAAAGEVGLRFLECAVVPEMPMLWMRSTSLTYGALMLYDGETSSIRIGLENTSTSPVDFVKLTFSDMHAASARAYVDENDLSPADAFEIESDILNRPVFSWTSSATPLLLPGASMILEVQCLGKIGCGNGTIQIDYSHVDRDVVKANRTFYTRQIFVDVFMTVHRALVAHSLDILRLKALPESAAAHARTASVARLGRRGAALDQQLDASLRVGEEGEHCLVSVDVMNAYGQPFEVAFENAGQHTDGPKARQRLEPGATARLLLRLDRIVVSAEKLALPIPSLSERQFIVAKVKRSPADERLSRELFWYREALLEQIEASWNEVGSLRTGTISLRTLRLTRPMLDILRGDEVDIRLSLAANPSSDNGVFAKTRGHRQQYTAASNEFVDVLANVVNKSTIPLDLTFTLDLRPPEANASPAALSHLSRYVIVDGLSSTSLGLLQPGEAREARVSICLLAEGRYELGVLVQEQRFGMVEEREMRAYVAREPLVIHVDR